MNFPDTRPILLGRLSAKDFPQDSSVTIELFEGSVCRFRNAFYHHEGKWIVIYSEHAGYHMFLRTALGSIKGLVREESDHFARLNLFD